MSYCRWSSDNWKSDRVFGFQFLDHTVGNMIAEPAQPPQRSGAALKRC